MFQRIDFKTLFEGHTYSSADRHFGAIEREAKKHDVIELPSDWVNIINQASISGSYNAKLLTFRDIFDYTSYLNNEFTYKYVDINEIKFLFTRSHYFNFGIGERASDGVVQTYSHPDTAWIRETLNPKENPSTVSFRKRKQKRKLADCVLHRVNNELKPLSSKIYCDINELSNKYLSTRSHIFYSGFPHLS
jgi:hypothetical protein